MLVIAGYVGFGGILFAVWEEWDAMASAYYCFITISTIGLGDLVPGFTTTTDSNNNVKMIGAAAYMIFGMALMSMGFDLIQYEMANKMNAVGGQNIGKAGDTVNELEGKEEKEIEEKLTFHSSDPSVPPQHRGSVIPQQPVGGARPKSHHDWQLQLTWYAWDKTRFNTVNEKIMYSLLNYNSIVKIFSKYIYI